MPKYNSRLFEGVAKKRVNKSMMDLSHEWKHDLQLGDYVPFLMLPTLPGDEFEIESEFFFKFEPMYYPIIHRCSLDADYFFVPNRIMWPAVTGDIETGWTNWIMLKNEQEHPTIDVDMEWFSTTEENNGIYGYLGIPYLMAGPEPARHVVITGLNAFPAMAYLMIWDQYYRNPQLEEERSFPLVAGDNTAAMVAAFGFETPTNVRLRCLPAKWMKDYFTSALPTPQAGDAIQIPMVNEDGDLPTEWKRLDDGTNLPGVDLYTKAADGETTVGGQFGPEVGLDIQETAASIRQLRLAEVLQSFRESLIKIGQRYRDYIIGIFAEDPTPMDISVPVMIGNYKGAVQVSEVFSQATTALGFEPSTNFYTGDYAGNASLYEAQNKSIRFQCREHGIIMGILNIMPNTSYGQGIGRYWRYSTPYDYPMDIFSTIGDQEILKEEVFYNNLVGEEGKNQETFGYIPRFSEARYFNNSYGSNLAWSGLLSAHLGRYWNPETTHGPDYDQRVELDNFFIAAAGSPDGGNVRLSDVFRTLTLPNGEITTNIVVAYVLHNIKALRPLPLYSTPSLTN